MKVAVLGAGSFGCAIASLLIDNDNQVLLWSYSKNQVNQLIQTRKNPHLPEVLLDERIQITNDIKQIDYCQLVVVVVPSYALRDVAKEIDQVLTVKRIVVICTKGLEVKTNKSPHQIINEEITKLKASVILSGPTHAEEVALKKLSTIVSTSINKEAREIVQQVFNCNYLRVYTNNDINGVEILGAAKNVLAIAAGFCDSHPFLGDNAKAALLTRGLRELRTIGDFEDCSRETFYGLTGLGDLIVTATSKYSRNRRFGELLGLGLTKKQAFNEIDMVVEGFYSVEAIHRLKNKNDLDLPIIEAIYQVLYHQANVNEILEALVKRPVKSEE